MNHEVKFTINVRSESTEKRGESLQFQMQKPTYDITQVSGH